MIQHTKRYYLFLMVTVVLIGTWSYSHSLDGPFFFDDRASIVDNPTIRHVATSVTPPINGETVTGRPLANISFALNYRLSGLRVWGYHLANLLLHTFNFLLIVWLIKKTFMSPALKSISSTTASYIALTAGSLWYLHPIQTDAVSAVSNRTESLCATFYLLMLVSLIKSTTNSKSWKSAVLLFFCAASATKEVAITAPAAALAFDWIFLSTSFAELWKSRGSTYLKLSGLTIFIVFIWLLGGQFSRGGSVGITGDISPLTYLYTQFYATCRYVKLLFWPNDLVADYGTYTLKTFYAVFPYAFLFFLAWAISLIQFLRKSPLGFAGLWFLGLLLPTSSIFPVLTQTIAERRVYLSSISPMVVAAYLAYRLTPNRNLSIAFLAVIPLAVANAARNIQYKDPTELWQITIARWPRAARPHVNLAAAYFALPEKLGEAIREFRTAISIDPEMSLAHLSLGAALQQVPGQRDEAIASYLRGLTLRPGYALGHLSVGQLMLRQNDPSEKAKGLQHLELAVKLAPKEAGYKAVLGSAYAQVGRGADAYRLLREAAEINPSNSQIRLVLALSLFKDPQHTDEGLAELSDLAASNPNSAAINSAYAMTLMQIPGREEQTIVALKGALLLDPSSIELRTNLGYLSLKDQKHLREGIQILDSIPPSARNFIEVQTTIAAALADAPGGLSEATERFRKLVSLQPNSAIALRNLALALSLSPGTEKEIEQLNKQASRLESMKDQRR